MPGPPKKIITKENVPYVYRYLLTTLPHPKRGMYLITGAGEREKALEKLRELSVSVDDFLQGSDRFAPKPDDLTAWCDKTLDDGAMSRIWTAYRQYLYKERHKVRRIGIKEKLYYRLASYAQNNSMTVEGALDDLLQRVSY